MGGGAADGLAVLDLGGQHIFLHMAGKGEQQGQQEQEQECQAFGLKPDDHQDAYDLAGVREHADNAGGEEILHGVHIAHEAGHHSARLLPIQLFGGKPYEFGHQTAPEGVGNLLSADRQQALAGRFQDSGQCQHGEIEQNQKQRWHGSQSQRIDDASQH